MSDQPPSALWRVVAQREISTRLTDRTFRGTAIFIILVVVGGIVAASLFAGRPQTYQVAVLDQRGAAVLTESEAALQAGGSADDRIEARTVGDRAGAERLVRDGDVDAALLPTVGAFEVLGDADVDGPLQRALAAGVQTSVLQTNADAQGVDLPALGSNTTAPVRLLDPAPSDSAARSAVALVFVILFLVTALGFGMQIAQSVVVEKESRIVEILAAAMPVRALLWGKIVGNTVLAVGQIMLTVAAGALTLVLVGQARLLGAVGPAIGWYLALFVLGFIALASLWSVAGSLASRQQDLQSTTLPGQLTLMIPYFVAVSGGKTVTTVFSMLPIVSTMIMPGRIAEGGVPLWQIGVAIATTVAAAVAFVRVGERMYSRTLLSTGAKIGYREALSRSE